MVNRWYGPTDWSNGLNQGEGKFFMDLRLEQQMQQRNRALERWSELIATMCELLEIGSEPLLTRFHKRAHAVVSREQVVFCNLESGAWTVKKRNGDMIADGADFEGLIAYLRATLTPKRSLEHDQLGGLMRRRAATAAEGQASTYHAKREGRAS